MTGWWIWPEQGFLFPAFQDRNTDIHRLLYYSKNANELCPDITEQLLGCVQPIPAGQQKESFQAIIEDTLGEECVYDVVRNIHENLNEMIEEQKENGEPLELDKNAGAQAVRAQRGTGGESGTV